MKDFISKFKPKDHQDDDSETKKEGHETEEKDDASEVEDAGPGISAGAKSKILILVASGLLITAAIYFFVIKEETKPTQEKLEEIKPAQGQTPQSGPSPFEFDKNLPSDSNKQSDVTEALDVAPPPPPPSLPALPSGPGAVDSFLNSGQSPQGQQSAEQAAAAAQLAAPGSQAPIAAPAAQPNAAPNPKEAPIIVFGGAAGPTNSVGYSQNIVSLNQDAATQLPKSESAIKGTFMANRGTTVGQGKFINVVLETAIDTEIPGSIRGIVTHDVYAESGNDVIIPRGTRLFGSYSSQINRGQGRVNINWSRLLRPDGVDAAIAFAASDQFGRAGIAGDVDNRYGPLFLNSMLTSILTIGTVAAANAILGNQNQQNSTTVNPQLGTTTTVGSASSQAASGLAQNVISTLGTALSNSIDVNPRIRIPQGTRVLVIVNGDITLPAMRKTKNLAQ